MRGRGALVPTNSISHVLTESTEEANILVTLLDPRWPSRPFWRVKIEYSLIKIERTKDINLFNIPLPRDRVEQVSRISVEELR